MSNRQRAIQRDAEEAVDLALPCLDRLLTRIHNLVDAGEYNEARSLMARMSFGLNEVSELADFLHDMSIRESSSLN